MECFIMLLIGAVLGGLIVYVVQINSKMKDDFSEVYARLLNLEDRYIYSYPPCSTARSWTSYKDSKDKVDKNKEEKRK